MYGMLPTQPGLCPDSNVRIVKPSLLQHTLKTAATEARLWEEKQFKDLGAAERKYIHDRVSSIEMHASFFPVNLRAVKMRQQ